MRLVTVEGVVEKPRQRKAEMEDCLESVKISTYPTQTSNKFDPIDEETLMSPKPFLATITLVNKSGTDVPAARIVRPIISEDNPIVSPIVLAHQTIK
jgi:hypothetical protein